MKQPYNILIWLEKNLRRKFNLKVSLYNTDFETETTETGMEITW